MSGLDITSEFFVRTKGPKVFNHPETDGEDVLGEFKTYLEYVGKYAVLTDINPFYIDNPLLIVVSRLLGKECNVFNTIVYEVGEDGSMNDLMGSEVIPTGSNVQEKARYIQGYFSPDAMKDGHNFTVSLLKDGILEVKDGPYSEDEIKMVLF